MKTLNTYTPNELKNIARRNFHTVVNILNEKGIQPLMQRAVGSRIVKFYGPEALEVVQQIRAADDAKKAEKQARKDAWAAKRAAAAEKKAEAQKRKEERQARLAAGLPVHGGSKKERKETPIDVIREQLPQAEQMALDLRVIPDSGPSLRELVMETNRLLQEMLDFWKK